jgi:hypothetical protein
MTCYITRWALRQETKEAIERLKLLRLSPAELADAKRRARERTKAFRVAVTNKTLFFRVD